MIEETELIFREEQRFSLWLRWLVVLSMALIVPFSIFPLTKMPSEQGPPEILPIILLIVAGVFVPIAIRSLFGLLKLETEVRSDGLFVRYFPFHIHFKRFTTDDLSEYYARKYKPIFELLFFTDVPRGMMNDQMANVEKARWRNYINHSYAAVHL